MAKVLITESHLDNIGSAIRLKRRISTTFKPSEMAQAIKDIQPFLQTKTITESGTYTPDVGYEGFSSVTVTGSGGGGGGDLPPANGKSF